MSCSALIICSTSIYNTQWGSHNDLQPTTSSFQMPLYRQWRNWWVRGAPKLCGVKPILLIPKNIIIVCKHVNCSIPSILRTAKLNKNGRTPLLCRENRVDSSDVGILVQGLSMSTATCNMLHFAAMRPPQTALVPRLRPGDAWRI